MLLVWLFVLLIILYFSITYINTSFTHSLPSIKTKKTLLLKCQSVRFKIHEVLSDFKLHRATSQKTKFFMKCCSTYNSLLQVWASRGHHLAKSIAGNHHTARTHASIIHCCYCMSSYLRYLRSHYPHSQTCFLKIYIFIAEQ
jgi:hypothetical protein